MKRENNYSDDRKKESSRTCKRFRSPWTVRRIGNRGKRRNTAKELLIFDGNCQRAMSSHRMTHNACTSRVQTREIVCYKDGKFFNNVGIHPIIITPWFCRSIDVKTSTRSEIPTIIFSRYSCPSW
jgi:hypothetical protein